MSTFGLGHSVVDVQSVDVASHSQPKSRILIHSLGMCESAAMGDQCTLDLATSLEKRTPRQVKINHFCSCP